MRDQTGSYLAVIKVVGIGGGGSNAVNRMVDAGLKGVEFVAVNTDAQALLMCDADLKLHIGATLDARPRRRRESRGRPRPRAESRDEIKEALKGADMVFVTAGEGGGTGTGGAPIVAEIARELGALTVGVVTRPFSFEGRRRAEQAQVGITSLQEKVDTLIVIPNDRLLQVVEQRDLGRRGVPHGGRRPAPGRTGHHRPDHRPRARQPRLRRRAHDHARRRLGAHGHRRGRRPEPRGRGGARGRVVAAPRVLDRRRDRDAPEHQRRRRHRPLRGQRGGRGRHRGGRPERERDLRRRDRRRARRSVFASR